MKRASRASWGPLALTAAALVLWPHSAHGNVGTADSESERIALRVSLSSDVEGCGDSGEFFFLLNEMRPNLRPAAQDEESIRIEVRLKRSESGVDGTMRLTSWEAAVSPEGEASGADCTDVLLALAFQASMDPGLRARRLPREQPKRTPKKTAAKPPDKKLLVRREPTIFREGASVREAPTHTRVAIGQRVLAQTATTPGIAWGLGLHSTIGKTGTLFAPALRLDAFLTKSGVIGEESAHTHFAWAAARLGGCPLLWTPMVSLELRPCAFYDIGGLEAAGVSLPETKTARVFWSAAGAEVAASWSASRGLSLGLETGGLVPLTHGSFRIREAGVLRPVYETPMVGLFIAAGVGWNFSE